MADTSACGLHPNDWRYVSEGGANIVLAYHGPPHPTFSHHLLRLAKSSSSSSRPTPHRQVAFQTRVVAKMLPPEFLLPFRVVQVSLEWLSAISQQLAESRVRPQDRVDKGGIDEEATEALLVRDMVSGDGVLTVEIKPKWGFLSPRSDDPGSSIDACRFCKHTLYRERGQGQAAREAHRTGYCPLDLYSMVPQRSERALDSLWSSWERTMGETNNFRLFWGGDRLTPTAESILALETSLGTPPLEFIKSRLPSQLSRILPLLSLLQSKHHPPSIHMIPTSAVAPTLEEFEVLLGQNDPPTQEGQGADVTAALLSGTFKDCSILIRFSRLDSVDWDIETKVIDLEEKSVTKIEGWQILERSLQEHWESLVQDLGRDGTGTIRQCTV